MTIDGSGVVSLNNAANFESQPSYSFDLTVGDGTTTVTEGIVVNIADINEAPELTTITASDYDENQRCSNNPCVIC